MDSWLRPFCVFLFLFASEVALASFSVEVRRMEEAGATELALNLLKQREPPSTEITETWVVWQRAYLNLLQRQRRWSTLSQLLSTVPDRVLPQEELLWRQTLYIRSLIKLQQFSRARQKLTHLLWQRYDDLPNSDWLRQWRHLLIECYSSSGDGESAILALQTSIQEYGSEDQEQSERLLQARVLLQSGDHESAQRLLEMEKKTDEGRFLFNLARIRQGHSLQQIIRTTLQQSKSEELQQEQRLWLLGVLAEAANRVGDTVNEIVALESIYQIPSSKLALDSLLTLSPEDLWDSYRRYALKVANREELLQGDYSAWLKLARDSERFYPIRSRSLLAYLLTADGVNEVVRQEAITEFIKAIEGFNPELRLLEALYLYDGRTEIFPAVATLLLDNALKDRDLQLASRLLENLEAPDEAAERFVWLLRKAKIDLLADKPEQCARILEELLPQLAGQSQQQLDRYLQLVFDLQDVGEHHVAVVLLKNIYQRVASGKLQRELLFWMADSYNVLEQRLEASRYYLESALYPGADSMDPWAQSARYKAAGVLIDLGFYADAQHQLQRLLKVAATPARRVTILREIERLNLQKGHVQ